MDNVTFTASYENKDDDDDNGNEWSRRLHCTVGAQAYARCPSLLSLLFLPCSLTQFKSESIFYSCCPSPSCRRRRRRRRRRVSHTLDALCCAGWAPHRIVIFIYLAFCKRNFQWNLNSSAVVVVVVGFCVLFDAMSAVFNFNQQRERFRQTQADPTAAAWLDGRDCLPGQTRCPVQWSCC